MKAKLFFSILTIVLVTSLPSIAASGNEGRSASRTYEQTYGESSSEVNSYNRGRLHDPNAYDTRPSHRSSRDEYAPYGPLVRHALPDSANWRPNAFNVYSTKEGDRYHSSYPYVGYSDKYSLLDPEVHCVTAYTERSRARQALLDQGVDKVTRKKIMEDEKNDKVKLEAMHHVSHYDGRSGSRGILRILARDKVLYNHNMPFSEAITRFESDDLPTLEYSDENKCWEFHH